MAVIVAVKVKAIAIVVVLVVVVVIVWLRTNGVNTTGAAAKVMSFDRLGKKVRLDTFGKINVGRLRGVPKKCLFKKT